MLRPTGFADLAGKRVGIFGYGVEGRTSAKRLAHVAASLVIVDDATGLGDDVLATTEGGREALLTCDVVLKSPGIARRRADILNLEANDVAVCSALNLWLHEVDRARVVAITGTKGKSTTTALITFFLKCVGDPAQSLGNIGQPPYDPALDTSSGWLVLEVSSYQCVDIDVAPQLVIVTSLGADHLDWHGSLAQYYDDKLSLTRTEGWHRTLVPDNATFRRFADQLGGDVSFVDVDALDLAESLGLLGAHSASNVSLALAAASALTGRSIEEVRERVRASASDFVPLRGRLTLVHERIDKGVRMRFVDDGLATSPLPTVAALEVFTDEPVALIAGGFDRGVEYTPLAEALAARGQPTLVITMGEAGDRIAAALDEKSANLTQVRAATMSEAVRCASDFVAHGGVALFSPAAPSFDRYRNWEERSDDFTREVQWSLGGDSNS